MEHFLKNYHLKPHLSLDLQLELFVQYIKKCALGMTSILLDNAVDQITETEPHERPGIIVYTHG